MEPNRNTMQKPIEGRLWKTIGYLKTATAHTIRVACLKKAGNRKLEKREKGKERAFILLRRILLLSAVSAINLCVRVSG
jgi:hypothetical protein